MKTKIFILAIIVILMMVVGTEKTQDSVKAEEIKPKLSHRQQVWLGALEWCESRGIQTAINEIDLDGTPSYYSFQFKPDTFKMYGEKYSVIEKGKSREEIMELLKEYDLQKQIVENMILDPNIRWERQFPWCVKKLGRPPKE